MMNAATANRNGNATPNTRNSKIPYQLLRSKAFDLKNCKQLILNQLRVLSLFHSKQNQDHMYPSDIGMKPLPITIGIFVSITCIVQLI